MGWGKARNFTCIVIVSIGIFATSQAIARKRIGIEIKEIEERRKKERH